MTSLPRAIWVLCAGTFINRFGGFVFPFLVLYVIHLGYTAAQAGVVAGAYGLGSFFAAGLGGELADRLGRRVTIAASMFASAAAMVALADAHGLVLVTSLAGFAGLAAEVYRPAAGALIADLAPPGSRVSAFAAYRFAINVGVAAGPAVAGLLTSRSFTLLFLGDAATSIIFGSAALVALPAETRRLAVAPEAPGLVRAVRADRAFLRFLLAATVSAMVYFQSQSTFALQVHADGLPNTLYGLLLSLNGLTIIALEVPLTSLTRRLPARPVIAAGMLLVGAGFGLVGVARTPLALALTVLVWTLGEMVKDPIASAYVADRAPAHLQGRYQGAYGLTSAIGLGLGPVLGALVFARSPHALWALCGALGVGSAVLLTGSRPSRDHGRRARRTDNEAF